MHISGRWVINYKSVTHILASWVIKHNWVISSVVRREDYSYALQNSWSCSQHAHFLILARCEDLHGHTYTSNGSLTLPDSRGHLILLCALYTCAVRAGGWGCALLSPAAGLCIQLTHISISLRAEKFAWEKPFQLSCGLGWQNRSNCDTKTLIMRIRLKGFRGGFNEVLFILNCDFEQKRKRAKHVRQFPHPFERTKYWGGGSLPILLYFIAQYKIVQKCLQAVSKAGPNTLQ